MNAEQVLAWIVIPMLTGAACAAIGAYFGYRIGKQHVEIRHGLDRRSGAIPFYHGPLLHEPGNAKAAAESKP